MNVKFFQIPTRAAALALAILSGTSAGAEVTHGIAMYGDPQLPPDFVSLPYANPDAPTGGTIVTGEVGSFDSLNPLVQKGSAPWQLRFIAYESLMGRNWDEPFSLYGLLAESIEVGPNREWAEFTLREEARFSDGSPVTVEDVMWSYETLGTEGHGRYRGLWGKIASMEQTGPRSVRFTFNEDNRELALIVGMRPILKKAQFDGVDFAESGLDVIPITTAPYTITAHDFGRFVELTRNPDYWGNDLPFRRGTNVIDTVRMEFFADNTAHFEAFKAGVVTTLRETNAEKWRAQYDFPAMTEGRMVKSEIPHSRPTGITGLAMNTRRPQFADWRVREALTLAFNFEYINDAISGGANPRITSYFSNSELGMRAGPAEGRVAELLAPFTDELLPGVLEGYTLPVSDGTERNRANLRAATALLEEAGWTVQDGQLADADGNAFTLEILLKQGSSEQSNIAELYAEGLSRIGITPTITIVESAQYTERTNTYDFDMTWYRRGVSLSPGNEQMLYWGSAGVTEPGTRNWMGINSPAAEEMIRTITSSQSRDDFVAATRALDRILTAGRYVIPVDDKFSISRIAHEASLKYPERLPVYGDWLGFQPDVWWIEE